MRMYGHALWNIRPSASGPTVAGGAYPGQRRHRRGVPRADVRVERRRRLERLRAEPPAVDADAKALARCGADAWVPDRTLGLGFRVRV